LTCVPRSCLTMARFSPLCGLICLEPMTLPIASPVRVDQPLQGIAWMVAGVFLLSVMDALSKHAVSQMSIPVLIAVRKRCLTGTWVAIQHYYLILARELLLRNHC